MNNKIKLLLAIGITTSLSTTALAQDHKFGLGIGVAPSNSAVIRGTINLDETTRLEPFFGFSYINPDKGDSTSRVELGTAFHLLKPINPKMNAYYGAYVSYQKNDTGNADQSLFILGPVAGVEYALDEQFTLGAEVNIGLGFGDATVFGTDSAVILRYYF